MKLKRFGPIVEHAASGVKLPEELARKIDDLSKAKNLPRDFTFRRIAKSPSDFHLANGERTDVSTITTDAIDRDGEVVLPGGGDWSSYNRVVPFAHRYDQLPVGSCWWMKGRANGVIAKTHYPEKPADWDGPWLPSAILHLMQQPVPSCTGKSIGFLPVDIRQPNSDDIAKRPELKDVGQIVSRWIGLEFSVCSIPANGFAEMIAVSKSFESGAIDRRLESLLLPALMSEKVHHGHHPAILAPVGDDHAAKLKAMAGRIKDSDLADRGREGKFHVTVDSHIATEDVERVKHALSGCKPFAMKLGKVSHFPADDHRNSDVVKVDADGEDLKQIHAKLQKTVPHTKELPYRPHCTLGYVKPGCGKDYDGMGDVDGMTLMCHALCFADHKGQHYTIPLGGDASASASSAQANSGQADAANSGQGKSTGAGNVDSSANNATGTAAQSPGGLVSDNKPEENARRDTPNCPKCQNNQNVVEDSKDDDGGGIYHCDLCKTQFRASHDGFGVWRVIHPDPDKPLSEPKAVKSLQVNTACVTRALKLVSEGKCDSAATSAPNGGDRGDDDCLAFDMSKPSGSAGRRKYPVIVGGVVKSHLVANAEARATQNKAGNVAKAAKRIMAAIQGREKALSDLPKLMPIDPKAEQQKQLDAARQIVRQEIESFLVLETGFKRVA